MSAIRIESHPPFVTLRLDKGRGNAIDEPLVEEIVTVCRDVSADRGVRGVLLASAHPKLFCPGLDLVTLLEYDRPALERFLGRFAEALWSLYALRPPMVAAIGGHAVAGGCILALTADYRVLRRGGVQVGLNEVKVGLPLPWSVATLLRASLPPRSLTQVALLGRNFADDEALAVGLVDQLADAADFEDFCRRHLDEFADKEPVAVAVTKAYLRRATLAEMKSREKEEASAFLDCWFSPAAQERLRQTVATLKQR